MAPARHTRSRARRGELKTSAEWYAAWRTGAIATPDGHLSYMGIRNGDGWRNEERPPHYWHRVLIREREFWGRVSRCTRTNGFRDAEPYGDYRHDWSWQF